MQNAIIFYGFCVSTSWAQYLVMNLYNSASLASPFQLTHEHSTLLHLASSLFHFHLRGHQEQVVSWIPPSVSSYKVIDGLSLGNHGPTSGGLVLRDFCGNIVAAKAVFFCHGLSLFAEI